ncbi:MAG: GntR family transcriptional regulator [Herbinix sp.]|nr:GntR family transcriptional regulator [Herbinix sp.]
MSKYTNLLCEEIRESIESYIIEHELKPSDHLPSERELAELFGANRLTVRAALKMLRNEHIIVTEHGKGNFIAQPKIVEDTTYFLSFSEGWKADGYTPTNKVIFFQIIEAPISVARHLELSLGEKVYKLMRIRYLNGSPIAFETSYIPHKYCPGLESYDFATESLYDTLMHAYHLKLLGHRENISITHLTKQEGLYLNAKENDPAYRIKGVTYNSEKVIEYCITLNCADRYILTSNLYAVSPEAGLITHR